MRLLMKLAAAMVLASGIAGAAEDSAVPGSTRDVSRVAQVATREDVADSRVDSGKEAAPGESAGMRHQCPMGGGDCPHMQHGKDGMGGDPANMGKPHQCPMGEGGCPHMQHGKDGMGGDPAGMGKPHKCPMAEGACPHHMQHGKDGTNIEDKPAEGDQGQVPGPHAGHHGSP